MDRKNLRIYLQYWELSIETNDDLRFDTEDTRHAARIVLLLEILFKIPDIRRLRRDMSCDATERWLEQNPPNDDQWRALLRAKHLRRLKRKSLWNEVTTVMDAVIRCVAPNDRVFGSPFTIRGPLEPTMAGVRQERLTPLWRHANQILEKDTLVEALLLYNRES